MCILSKGEQGVSLLLTKQHPAVFKSMGQWPSAPLLCDLSRFTDGIIRLYI